MTDTKHTPEPWSVLVDEEDGEILDISITQIQRSLYNCAWADLEEYQRDLANASRIVTCVNACAGMPDPAAEIAALRAEVEKLKAALRSLIVAKDTGIFEVTVETDAKLEDQHAGRVEAATLLWDNARAAIEEE